MKHNFKVTFALVAFFLIAQVVGLLVINNYIDHKKTAEEKQIVVKPLPYGFERPEIENESTSFIYIFIAVIIGTLIVLLLIKFNRTFIWKSWFFLTVWLTLSIAFSAFIEWHILAAAIALVIAYLKLYRPSIFVQNFSEVFIYGGLAAIFVPMLNVFAAFMLLLFISIYDFIAVNKTKHMVKMATFQSKSKVFAGLYIPYERKKGSQHSTVSREIKEVSASGHNSDSKQSVAVLGGGDIGFTLIFAGVVMKDLMLKETILMGFLKTLIIPLFVSIALLILLIKGKKDKFYPAMPVLSIGCLVGYLVLLLF